MRAQDIPIDDHHTNNDFLALLGSQELAVEKPSTFPERHGD
jgi:hypothetical protein